MSVTHNITISMDDGTQTITKTQAVTAGTALVLDESIPDSSTNLATAFAFAYLKLQSLWMLSDKAITIYTNEASTGAPQDTIALAANVPWLWIKRAETGAVANPFAGNVTSLFVTNASGAAAALQIRAIVDPT